MIVSATYISSVLAYSRKRLAFALFFLDQAYQRSPELIAVLAPLK